MTGEADLTYAVIGLFSVMTMFYLPFIVFIKLGGWPEGFYRIFRVKYFSAIFIDAEGTPRRFPLRLSEIKTGEPTLPPYFNYKGFANAIGRYYCPQREATKHSGRSSWYYYPDNPYPIPMKTLGTSTDISAEKLNKAFGTELMTQFLGIGKPKPEKKRSFRGIYIALAALLAFLVIGMILSLGVKL